MDSKTPKIRSFFDRTRTKQHVGEGSHVQQNMADETDINNIMSKYQKHGVLTHVNRYAGQYGDFSGVPDYKTGLERVQAAEEMFQSLPAKIRDRFGNDPAQFIDFATDASNIDEMRKMGLAPAPAPVAERPNSERKEPEPPPGEMPQKPNPKGDQ
nr:MAG: internal scaffolding protein [Microvirus sp.]